MEQNQRRTLVVTSIEGAWAKGDTINEALNNLPDWAKKKAPAFIYVVTAHRDNVRVDKSGGILAPEDSFVIPINDELLSFDVKHPKK